MHKKHTVRLMELGHRTCGATIDKLMGSSQKARRAEFLLRMDVDRPAGRGGLPGPHTNRGESAAALCAGRLRAGSERGAEWQLARTEASMRRAGGGVDRAASGPADGWLRDTFATAAGVEGRGAWDHWLDQPRNRQTEFRKVATAPARLMPALPLDSRISNWCLPSSVPDMESAWTTSCATTLSDPCARSVGDRALCGRVALASCGVQAAGPHAAATGRGLSRGQRGQGRPACAACSFTTGAGAA